MSLVNDAAQLLVACWSLGEDKAAPLPTSHGILDHALRSAVEEKAFPEWFRRALHFSDSRIGLQCVELPAMLDWAQRSELTSAPNPSYQRAELRISQRAARALLHDLDVEQTDAARWGHSLRDAAEEIAAKLEGFGCGVAPSETGP